MLLSLTHPPTLEELDLFQAMLTENDQILLTGRACHLAFKENPLPAQGFIRLHEAQKTGGTVHENWRLVTEQQWTQLILDSEKNVEW